MESTSLDSTPGTVVGRPATREVISVTMSPHPKNSNATFHNIFPTSLEMSGARKDGFHCVGSAISCHHAYHALVTTNELVLVLNPDAGDHRFGLCDHANSKRRIRAHKELAVIAAEKLFAVEDDVGQELTVRREHIAQHEVSEQLGFG